LWFFCKKDIIRPTTLKSNELFGGFFNEKNACNCYVNLDGWYDYGWLRN